MKGDLISRAALYKAWDALDKTQDPNLLIDAMIRETQDAPAVDAEPVRHGEWRRYPECGVTRCSVCYWSIEECFSSNYCQNCGAKMDAEVNT